MPQSMRFSRRRFLQTSVAVAAAARFPVPAFCQTKNPNSKLNIAAVGTGGQATSDIAQLADENIAVLCDVDENTLAKAAAKYAGAKKYVDFREMLGKEQANIDAVLVATPDHIHAPAAMMAMKLGKHVYCEKPLAHEIFEVRAMTRLAAEKKLVTQMGTQIHATENYRRVVEVIQSGAIGPVKEVMVWCFKTWGAGKHKPAAPPPANLHWDLWLGPAPQHDYEPGVYHPAEWRRWWDFGTGTLGDMACHLMDLPFWALDLKSPISVEAHGDPVDPETAPVGLTATWEFPGRGNQGPVKVTWCDGRFTPKQVAGHGVPGMGVMFLGEKGQMFADYGGYKLYPEIEFKGYKPPAPTIPRSIGHYKEWARACKDGGPTTCNFNYAGPLTEAVLLGVVAYRSGKKLQWDPENLKIPNEPEVEKYLKREYRAGWTL